MTEHDSPELVQLAELAHLPADDPRLVEAMRSPRARAILASYREFETPEPAPAEARVAESDAALAAVLERELALPVAPAVPSRGARRASWWGKLFAPAWRPAWAFAGLIAIAALAWVGVSQRGPGPERVMRGSASDSFEASLVEQTASGAVFGWPPVPGADRYVARLYAADLVTVLAVHELRGETRWTLPAAQYPDALQQGEGVAWQVTAYRGDEELAESRLQTLAAR